MTDHYASIIGGERVGAGTVPNINPSNLDDVIGYAPAADELTTKAAIHAAASAAGNWADSTPQQRFDVLDSAGSEMLERSRELATLLAREEGKPIAEAVGEVTRAGHILKYFAGEAVRGTGHLLPSVRPGITVEVTREPLGVVGIITPWNFPIAIPTWKIAPAIAFGNTVVFKPAENTPGMAWELTAILHRAGLPAGVLNLVYGRGSVVGEQIVTSHEVAAISFTGSATVGRSLIARAAAAGKKIQAEMGGKNPMVVLDDADLNVAVSACLNGAYFSTGQRCTASSRLIVTAGIHDAFVRELSERMRAMTVGDALDPQTTVGPVVDDPQLQRNIDYLDIARDEGATVIGGERLVLKTPGHYFSPALITGTRNDMRVNREEIFGPIASVIKVGDADEALTVANQTEFGLSAGVCTTSLHNATRFKRELRAGMVMVNAPTAGVDYHVPFGGTKGSSYGPREQGTAAQEMYTITKTAYTSA